MLSLSRLVVLALCLAQSPQPADAHGKLLKPEAKMRAGTAINENEFVGEINGDDIFKPADGESWSGDPQKNAQLFTKYFLANRHKTLRHFFQAIEPKMKPRFPGKTDNICGFTGGDTFMPATVPTDGVIEWGNIPGQWGFQSDHYGPCEAWCDDKLVLQNMDCLTAFGKELPARMKIDAAQCSGAKRLQFLWLAVHFSNWQYWLNCVPLAGSIEATNASASPQSVTPVTTEAPSPVVVQVAKARSVAVPTVSPIDVGHDFDQQEPAPLTNAHGGDQDYVDDVGETNIDSVWETLGDGEDGSDYDESLQFDIDQARNANEFRTSDLVDIDYNFSSSGSEDNDRSEASDELDGSEDNDSSDGSDKLDGSEDNDSSEASDELDGQYGSQSSDSSDNSAEDGFVDEDTF